jgi:hypothetical protein
MMGFNSPATASWLFASDGPHHLALPRLIRPRALFTLSMLYKYIINHGLIAGNTLLSSQPGTGGQSANSATRA